MIERFFRAMRLESAFYREAAEDPSLDRESTLLVILVASGVAAIVYWLWHAGGLASVARIVPQSMAELISQVVRIANGLARYYVYLFGLLAMIAFFLAGSLRGPERWGNRSRPPAHREPAPAGPAHSSAPGAPATECRP